MLATEAAEFQRGAIAMRHVRELSKQITSVERQDTLIRSVYQSDLARAAAAPATDSDGADTTPMVAKLAEILANTKKP